MMWRVWLLFVLTWAVLLAAESAKGQTTTEKWYRQVCTRTAESGFPSCKWVEDVPPKASIGHFILMEETIANSPDGGFTLPDTVKPERIVIVTKGWLAMSETSISHLPQCGYTCYALVGNKIVFNKPLLDGPDFAYHVRYLE